MTEQEKARLLSADVQAFLQAHATDDPARLLLQAPPHPDWPMRLVVQQLQARQKARHKLPTWYATPGILFPVGRSVEQASSERTAAFKASRVSGDLLVDLTGGFGVDSSFFARSFARVVSVEADGELSALAAHNGAVFGQCNIAWHSGPAETFLPTLDAAPDCIYLDPDRRPDRLHSRVVSLEDARPDVVSWLPALLERAPRVLIKASPLLDLPRALLQLRTVTQAWVVAVANECKEVLLLAERQATEPRIHAVHLTGEATEETFTFTFAEEAATEVTLAAPQRYLYEPHAALLKAGAFRTVGQRYGLAKLHPNSHLYTSQTLVPDFPGRRWEVGAVTTLNKKALHAHFPEGRAHVLTRNFPLSPEHIRKKLKLGESDTRSLIATTNPAGKPIVVVGTPLR
ncbi:hypothetical protein SAMN05421823_103348 [Catalinimonas alkaloidigena]|uniref:Uncharacterized protein n=1 Tax=Catalinimonas alkaloidigena TaxID=1075417 RepID=A0A1G9E4Q1_9BACT|nr:class I SAM-dependent methyltransferase [Catalinimonas alkaloidigena]SDK71080.1 hypothetical protein SAMN05421823_103348 [Catalinimonas alkaloidigena]